MAAGEDALAVGGADCVLWAGAPLVTAPGPAMLFPDRISNPVDPRIPAPAAPARGSSAAALPDNPHSVTTRIQIIDTNDRTGVWVPQVRKVSGLFIMKDMLLIPMILDDRDNETGDSVKQREYDQ